MAKVKRLIFASAEMSELSKRKPVKIYSVTPIDKGDCVCAKAIFDWKRKMAEATFAERNRLLAETPYLVCPRDKINMSRYVITCGNCGDIQGYCWATSPDLIDWCDFHYVQWVDKGRWHGCFTPNVSPITEQLTLECCCGQDIRDFRANMTLSQKVINKMEEASKKGREFNQPDSKFLVKQFKGNVLT